MGTNIYLDRERSQIRKKKDQLRVKKFARSLHEEEHECRETNCFYCKESHITKDREKCNEYRKELKIK